MKYLNIKKALAAWQELQPLSEKDRDEKDENVWWYDGERGEKDGSWRVFVTQ